MKTMWFGTIWAVSTVVLLVVTMVFMQSSTNNAVATVVIAQSQSEQHLMLRGANGYLCPVAGKVSFIDSWHFPRSGGRLHKGQDMFAKLGTPLVALIPGTITAIRHNVGLGGNAIWLTGASGESWYYAHMHSFAPGLHVGQKVQQGQYVGQVGKTGNARTTPAHLHIQYRPGGFSSADQNNYFILNPACPR